MLTEFRRQTLWCCHNEGKMEVDCRISKEDSKNARSRPNTELFSQTHGARAKLKGISIEQQKVLMENEYPHKRLITVEEVAATVDFLLTDQAASITGHLLNVDGGRSIT